MLTAVGLLIAFIGIWVDVLDNQNRYILPLLISGILILAVSSAIAQEHHHPPQDQTIHERFYSTWMMPDNRNMSCCRKTVLLRKPGSRTAIGSPARWAMMAIGSPFRAESRA
jgi:hypothetical protein